MTENAHTTSNRTRLILVGSAIVLAFFAAYGFASARTQPQTANLTSDLGAGQGAAGAACDSSGGEGAAGACSSGAQVDSSACGSGDGGCGTGSSEIVEGGAVADGDVQRISVDVSEGYFNPNVLRLAAGVPTVITFGEGSGCMAEVMIKDFGVFENLTQGGAVVEIPALQPGEYGFSCGMEMVFGVLVVE